MEDREIVLVRRIKAPREFVWEAYTKPEHVAQWFGPNGFTLTVLEMDVRVGGVWRFLMHGPDGTDYPNRVEYVELDPPAKMVFWHGHDDPNDPEKFLVTITMTTVGTETEVVQRTVFPTAEQRKAVESFGAVELGRQTYEKLAEYVETRMARR